MHILISSHLVDKTLETRKTVLVIAPNRPLVIIEQTASENGLDNISISMYLELYSSD